MGNKDKKKHSYRSRSRSRDRHRDSHKKKKEKRRRSESDPSDRSTRSPSPVRRKRSHKDKDRRRSRSWSRDKKSKRRQRSGSRSSNSDSSEPSSQLPPAAVSKEEEKKEKELKKALETPEEKRARRLAKKEAKERRRKEQMGWDQEYMGYTNVDNPFGDEHLLDTFVWTKKIEKEGKKHLTTDEIQKQQKLKMRENKVELEKVKKRRLEREKEREERENERDMMMREKELEYFREWEKQEDNFHLNQAKMRSEIRIKDGRAKPIDLLAKYISAEDDAIAVEMHEPYTYLYGLTITDLEDLLEDIRVYLELEEGKNADYWRDIITVTEDELQKLRKLDAANKELADRREGINPAVNAEVGGIFKGKTTNQLKLLEQQIRDKLSGGEGVDVGYWETLLKQLKAHTARTRLRERHQDVLQQKLLKLKREQGLETGPLFPVLNAEQEGGAPSRSSTPSTQSPRPPADAGAPGPSTSAEDGTAGSGNDDDDDEALITEADLEEENAQVQEEDQYVKGGYSPRLLQPGDLDIDTVIYEEEEDVKKLMVARRQVLTSGRVKLDHETEFEKQAREGMNDDEAQFSVQMTLEPQAFVWSDKYRPRKPRFFNRVHTGFEWNKYNQTHYDIDNPPPKIVQGYKFNIFYPDLIDKTKTPEYTVTPLEDSKDFAVLRFKAGPPYEDIAFKIVNREWEYSYKRGFRCQFQNNIFQLWFHFKRYRYRR
ncbi:splicing factor Cactin-like [Babylonia areolata]|uniref:splicing factor Cactin-like n=1 Tax=Babylonia areolata TaxID=304850 RepID=UPI003FCFB224